MSDSASACGFLAAAVLATAWPLALHGQITITGSDLFNKPGQYYQAYVEKDANVGGLLGVPSATAQAWDFTSGPTDLVYRFDYLDIKDAPEASAFPEAGVAERLTDSSSATVKWLYLKQVPGVGRQVFGFRDPDFSSSQPTAIFAPPILDFPEHIGYGDNWKSATEFMSEISFGIPDDGGDDEEGGGGGNFSIPTRVTYTAESKVDAFGLVNQPKIGFGECLRVNELVQYDIAVDFGFGDGFMSISTQFIRNYYWLRRSHGIVVQVTSRQLDTPPPDDFTVAAAVTRMFETNHEEGGIQLPTITGLRITLGKEGALLQWTKGAGLARYKVEYLTGDSLTWKTLVESTASNFVLDAAANKPGAPIRLYRVVGFN
jgi:hypothetical protein